jgi:hypothetical protein
MHFLSSGSPDSFSSIEEAMNLLENIFSSDWRSREDEIASCIRYLRDEKRLLSKWAISSLESGKIPEMIGAQSFLVHQSLSFICRINLWFPQGSLGVSSDLYGRYLSIDVLHNHDFDFYTTCLLGGGYTSNFLIATNGADDLEVGDQLMVGSEQFVHLDGDKTIFVEKGFDFHTQRWPADFSITLNVIPVAAPMIRQYSVNPADLRVKFVVNAARDLKHQLQ